LTATLFTPPPATGDLTPRQRFVYDLLSRPRSDDEIGAWLYAARGVFPLTRRGGPPPTSGTPSQWFAENGRAVLSALRRRGLVVRRRSGFWERKDGSSRHEGPGEAIPF